MSSQASPDLDWYLDHVVLPSGPDHEPIGPIRAWQADWTARARELRDVPPSDASRQAAVDLALRQGFVLTRAQTLATGLRSADVRRLVYRGEWCAPRRGIVAVVRSGGEAGAALAATAAALARPGHVISHRSAAVLHGLPLLDRPPLPELTARPPTVLGDRGTALVRGAALGASDVAEWFGAQVTTVARTIVDLARGGRPVGLVAADAALRERVVTATALDAAARHCTGWPGARSARDVVSLASPLAESPLESLTRLCLVDAGLPVPALQVRITDPADGWWCRVDMLWPQQRVVLEADGRVKYTDRELWREKRRQHRLERLGFRVVRAIWHEVVTRPDELVARVRDCLAASPPG